jgi:hypothetical protein
MNKETTIAELEAMIRILTATHASKKRLDALRAKLAALLND